MQKYAREGGLCSWTFEKNGAYMSRAQSKEPVGAQRGLSFEGRGLWFTRAVGTSGNVRKLEPSTQKEGEKDNAKNEDQAHKERGKTGKVLLTEDSVLTKLQFFRISEQQHEEVERYIRICGKKGRGPKKGRLKRKRKGDRGDRPSGGKGNVSG